jgi:hypothetical protein
LHLGAADDDFDTAWDFGGRGRQTDRVIDVARLERAMPWVLRAVWIGVLVAGGAAIDEATASSADSFGDAVRYASLAAWFAGVCAMALPAVVSLTAVRLIVPLGVPAAVVALVAGADATSGIIFLVLAVLACVVAFSALLGRVFVQASAYGEEDRHLLRPPAAYVLAAGISWAVWAALSIGAVLLLADRRWIIGAVVAVAAIGVGVLGWPRWHRLSRRWFVIVPIGIVIHDQLVLAETVMLRRQEIAGIRLAPAGTEAADLTGPAAGHAVEVATHESTTVIFAATPKEPRGTAIHLRSCLVAPSRPGEALQAAARRRLPVG